MVSISKQSSPQSYRTVSEKSVTDNWGDDEFLWRLHLRCWEKLVHIYHHYTKWLNGVTHDIQAHHVLYPVLHH
jgi:hypothetical protein